VADRQYIKQRAAKLVAKQRALDAKTAKPPKPIPLPASGAAFTSVPSPRG
jgi:hypothetical protein